MTFPFLFSYSIRIPCPPKHQRKRQVSFPSSLYVVSGFSRTTHLAVGYGLFAANVSACSCTRWRTRSVSAC